MGISKRFAIVGIAALLVIGCGSASAPAERQAPGGGQGGQAGTGQGQPRASNAPLLPIAAGSAAQNGGQGDGSQNGGSKDGIHDNAPKPEDYIVKTGLIRIRVADLDGSILRATDVMHSLGGYLAGSQRATDGNTGLASVTYRVPASKFEDALAEARKLGNKIVNEHTETTPVGGQIVDLQARIDNLKASEKAIQGVMAKASTIPDILTVETRLSDVQGQIEELTAQLTSLTDQATYSTLTMEFEVPVPGASPTPTASPSPAAAWSVSREFDQASGALASIAQAVATILIWFVVVLVPVGFGLVLLAAFALVLMRLWRRMAPVVRREAGLEPAPPAEP